MGRCSNVFWNRPKRTKASSRFVIDYKSWIFEVDSRTKRQNLEWHLNLKKAEMRQSNFFFGFPLPYQKRLIERYSVVSPIQIEKYPLKIDGHLTRYLFALPCQHNTRLRRLQRRQNNESVDTNSPLPRLDKPKKKKKQMTCIIICTPKLLISIILRCGPSSWLISKNSFFFPISFVHPP